MITMTEIARLTNVSQPTVSRVLNGSRSVAPEIRERVLACAREHDYQPNVLAKGLQGSKTQLLGVLVTDISNGVLADLTKEVEAAARKRGYSVLLLNSGRDPKNERQCLDVVRRYRADGLLAVPAREASAEWHDYAKKLDIPTVSVTCRTEGVDSVYVDCVQAGAMVAKHLTQRGYQRFLFIGWDHSEKYTGFRRALDGMGYGKRVSSLACQDDGQLRQALRGWFRSDWGRAAVFAEDDAYALRVMDALRALGLSVPGNVGVIGFGDASMGRYLSPRLTTVSQPVTQMAQEAVSRLLDRICGPKQQERMDLVLSGSLVIREST